MKKAFALFALLALLLALGAQAQTRTGSPSIVNGSAASGSTNVTVPNDANLVVAFWSHWQGGTGSTLSTLTLNGVSFAVVQQAGEGTIELDPNTDGVGVAVLANPATGSQTLAWAWSDSATRMEGGGLVLVYLTGADTSDPVRSVAIHAGSGTSPVSATVSAESTDLLLAYGSSFSLNPSLTFGGGAPETVVIDGQEVNSRVIDVAEDTTPAASVVVSMASTSYSAIAAVVIKEGSAPEPTLPEIESVMPSTFADEDTGIVIAGSNFGETEGEVLICPTDDVEDMDCEAQTVTAWADDEITFTAVQGGLEAEATLYLFVVTDDGGANEEGFEVEFLAGIVATKLVFGQQPGNIVVGQTWGAFTVQAVDDEDALDEDFTDNVTLSLCMGDGTLGGTTTVAAVAGVATFDDIFLNTLNDDAVMCADSGELTQAQSDPFDVTAGGGGASGIPATSTLGGALQR